MRKKTHEQLVLEQMRQSNDESHATVEHMRAKNAHMTAKEKHFDYQMWYWAGTVFTSIAAMLITAYVILNKT